MSDTSAIEKPIVLSHPDQQDGGLYLWTIDQYHQLIEDGALTEYNKVELIEGRLIKKMSISKAHRDCLDLVNTYFIVNFGSDYLCSPQNPISLSQQHSEPEPDFAVINRRTYANRPSNPEAEDILLLIEIANTTLEYDRSIKSKMYAQANILEYWIINLQNNQIELHLNPLPEQGKYASVQYLKADETLNSPFAGEIAVKDFLPNQANK
ncbi:MAG: Uma2 family endonuclease [Bacteroidota bacterium]